MTVAEKMEKAREAVTHQRARKQAALAALATTAPARRGRSARQPRLQRPAAPPTGPPGDDKLLLSYEDLVAIGINYSREHLRRLMRAGKFPAAVAFGPEQHARRAWRRESIERWLNALEPVGGEAA